MKRLALWTIEFYQQRISPGRPPACRFLPTCSHYAHDAIESRGVLIGGAMAFWRILRCNPLNDGGYDAVPRRRSAGTRQSPR